MSVNFSSGTTPMPNDTRWVLLVKILQSLNDGAASGGGGVGTAQLLQGSGAPGAAPADPTLPAYYTDRDSGIIFFWNTVAQAWQ